MRDQRLIREGIASLLGLHPGIEVVGTAADGHEAVEQAVLLTPDVVLMDVRMPGMDGVEAVAVLRRRAPPCRVVMLTTFDDEDYVVRSLRAGATGYLLKDLLSQELAASVRLAAAGVTQFDPAAAARLAAALERTGDREPLTVREIADRLHLSEGTVKNHLSRILGRLGLRDRTQAALYAQSNGLV